MRGAEYICHDCGCQWNQSSRVEPAPKEVPEMPEGLQKHDFECPYGSLVYISGFGSYVRANFGIGVEIKYVDWLAACDGCTAEAVVAKMREAGR